MLGSAACLLHRDKSSLYTFDYAEAFPLFRFSPAVEEGNPHTLLKFPAPLRNVSSTAADATVISIFPC